ncbi:MAG: MBL fold metallo-hydrolase [Longimicrobiales bacterium]|nr:MBL fold metallo-hydrolase [Longimicrobiales bacterium]
MNPLRSVLADNPGPFTHEGTRTHIVGRRRVAVVDPGPDLEEHVEALCRAVAGAGRVTVLLTHGHADHAGAVDALLARLPGAEVAGAGHAAARPLADGAVVETDAGPLVTLSTPGHTRDHLAFHHPPSGALFPGDMVLGVGDTTWVAEYPGCVAEWLDSLARLEALAPRVIHPAHGPDVHDPTALFARYRAHREARIAAVRAALAAEPGLRRDALLARVYGDGIPAGLRPAALQSLAALVEYVERSGPGAG